MILLTWLISTLSALPTAFDMGFLCFIGQPTIAKNRNFNIVFLEFEKISRIMKIPRNRCYTVYISYPTRF